MPGSNNRSSYEGVFGDSPSSSTPAKKTTSQPSSPKNRFPLTGPKEDPLASGNERIKQEVAERRAKTGETDLGNVRKAEEGDFRDVKSFSDAFGRARKLGLKTFQWGNTGMIYGTQLASGTKPADPSTETRVKTPVTPAAPVSDNTTSISEDITPVSGTGPYKPMDGNIHIFGNGRYVTTGLITESPERNPIYEPQVPARSYPYRNTPSWSGNTGVTPNRESKPVVQEPQRPSVTTPSGSRSVPATTARYTAQNTVGGDFGINRALRRFGNWISNTSLNKPRPGTQPKDAHAPGPILPESGKQAIKQAIGVAGGVIAGGPFRRNYIQSLSGPPGTIPEYGATLQGSIGFLTPGYVMADQAHKYQKGGKLEGKEKAFASYLIELSGASSDEELQRFILETGEDEMKNIYLQWERNDGNMGITEAKLGAKLAYIKALRGECPEGYEVEKYMVGGCVKCRKKAEAGTTIEAFKEKCGGKAKKRIKKNKDGGGVNPNDTIHTKKGIRDLNGRTKYPKFNPKDATQSEKDRASEKDYLNTKKSGNDPSRPGTVKKRVTKKD